MELDLEARCVRVVVHAGVLHLSRQSHAAEEDAALHAPIERRRRADDRPPPRLVELLSRQGCGIDGFIHSAGIVKILPVRMVDPAAALEVMNTNFLSALEIVRILVKKKVNQTNLKTVTFISSAASKLGERGNSVYAASKGALDSLTRSLAVELAPDVRVNAVLPGMVRTSMSSSTIDDRDHVAEILKKYPLGFGDVTDVAALVRFLVSDEARWITGQHLIVDGGRTCI